MHRTGWSSPKALFCAFVLSVVLSFAANATPVGALALSSDGTLGDVTWNTAGVLNTDNSGFYTYGNSGGLVFDRFIASSLVSQADSSLVRVFQFSSLTLNSSLILLGSLPAALISTGNITINNTLLVQSAQGPGGAPHSAAPGSTGGQPGVGDGFHVDPPCCGYSHGAGGGGGGKASAGGQGYAGDAFPSGINGVGGAGGQADTNTTILSGGGGGGGGARYAGVCCDQLPGGRGGNGGGAAFIQTDGDFVVTAQGSVVADGSRGEAVDASQGAGGGGAGGMLWFEAGGQWTNYGLVSARGAKGGWVAGGPSTEIPASSWGGAGGGGYVFIDPPSIQNFGTIDVSGGSGDPANGGIVETFGQLVSGSGAIVGTIPEPASLALLAAGLLPLPALRRARRPTRTGKGTRQSTSGSRSFT